MNNRFWISTIVFALYFFSCIPLMGSDLWQIKIFKENENVHTYLSAFVSIDDNEIGGRIQAVFSQNELLCSAGDVNGILDENHFVIILDMSACCDNLSLKLDGYLSENGTISGIVYYNTSTSSSCQDYVSEGEFSQFKGIKKKAVTDLPDFDFLNIAQLSKEASRKATGMNLAEYNLSEQIDLGFSSLKGWTFTNCEPVLKKGSEKEFLVIRPEEKREPAIVTSEEFTIYATSGRNWCKASCRLNNKKVARGLVKVSIVSRENGEEIVLFEENADDVLGSFGDDSRPDWSLLDPDKVPTYKTRSVRLEDFIGHRVNIVIYYKSNAHIGKANLIIDNIDISM